MPSLRTSRLLACNPLIRPATHRQCPRANPRTYATKPSSSKPNPKATSAKLNTVRKKAASRKSDTNLENESLAARIPLKKPSSDGLGVPSASPSAQAPPSTKGKPSSAATGGTIADVTPAEAEKKDAMLRAARQARVERTRVEEERRQGEREYAEKEGAFKRTYLGVVIGLPIAAVLSWVLWNRLANGNQQRLPRREDE